MSSSSIYELVQLPRGLSQFCDVSIPGSKSSLLRALLLSTESSEATRIYNVLRSDDTAVMLKALEHLGATITFLDATNLIISGPLIHSPEEREINLGESGLSLRLLLVHLSLFGKGLIRFRGRGRLLSRPLAGLINTLSDLGVSIVQDRNCITATPNSLPNKAVEINLDPSVSSQWASALALSLAHHPHGGTINFIKPIISKSYLNLTSTWLKKFACIQSIESNQWKIPGGLTSPGSCVIEGDWSSAAAFILASATQGISLCLKGLNNEVSQGDQFLLEILSSSCARHYWKEKDLYIEGVIKKGIHADLSSCPDLAPVLAAACAIGTESSHLWGLQTLQYKESDRFQKIQELIHWLGGTCEINNHSNIIIHPRSLDKKPLVAFDPGGDHRMAFAAALGALKTGGAILNPFCVNKTFPDFWIKWRKMLGLATS